MLIEVEGKMNDDQNCQILSDGVVESFEKLEMEEGKWYFQQNNDPKHTSQKATKWFEDNYIQVLSWPAWSPDLNTSGNISNDNFASTASCQQPT